MVNFAPVSVAIISACVQSGVVTRLHNNAYDTSNKLRSNKYGWKGEDIIRKQVEHCGLILSYVKSDTTGEIKRITDIERVTVALLVHTA